MSKTETIPKCIPCGDKSDVIKADVGLLTPKPYWYCKTCKKEVSLSSKRAFIIINGKEIPLASSDSWIESLGVQILDSDTIYKTIYPVESIEFIEFSFTIDPDHRITTDTKPTKKAP